MIRGTLALSVTAIILGLTGQPSMADEEYYRWVDSNGNQVHSDRPPPSGTPYEIISVKTSNVRQMRENEDRDQGAGEDEADQWAARRSRFTIEKDPERCAQARENLATLETAPRIRIIGDDGEYRFLSSEERQLHKQNAEANISTYCEDE